MHVWCRRGECNGQPSPPGRVTAARAGETPPTAERSVLPVPAWAGDAPRTCRYRVPTAAIESPVQSGQLRLRCCRKLQHCRGTRRSRSRRFRAIRWPKLQAGGSFPCHLCTAEADGRRPIARLTRPTHLLLEALDGPCTKDVALSLIPIIDARRSLLVPAVENFPRRPGGSRRELRGRDRQQDSKSSRRRSTLGCGQLEQRHRACHEDG